MWFSHRDSIWRHIALWSSNLRRKVEQQSFALLHTTLFSRQCHCSYSHYLCALLPTVHCSTIYTTTHSCWTCHYAVTVLQYVQCHHLPNCTATYLEFLQRFITVRPSARIWWHVWEIRKSYDLCYLFILLCLPRYKVAEPTYWLRWCAVKHYLTQPVNTWTVTVVMEGAYCSYIS